MSRQQIERGQIWERLTDGVRIVIDAYAEDWDDATYHRLDRSRSREIFGDYLRSRYRLVEDPT